VTIKSEGFEGNFPNEWQLYGNPTWDDESYRALYGAWSGYCVGSSVAPPGPYPAYTNSWMAYGPFSLVGATDARLDFYRWLYTESGYDYLGWGASVDGTNFYGYQVSGDARSWQPVYFDLKNVPELGNLCGRPQAWVAFWFTSDETNQYEGAYLDTICLRKYSSTGQPDLTPYTPAGWDFPIVPSNVRGTHQVPARLEPAPDTTFIDMAVINQGSAATSQRFYIYLYEDGTPFAGWYVDPPLNPGSYAYAEDYARLVSAGSHSVSVFADSTNAVVESSETNNRWSHSWTWGGGGAYDHVVVTAASIASHFGPLCSFIENHLGLNDTVVTVEAIYSAFPGRDNPEKIRNFVIYACDNWSTTHVLLGGDVDKVPCRYAYGRVGSSIAYIPCDLYFSDLDGTWDADGDNIFGEVSDNVDMYPDVFVGRIPASSAAEVDRFCAKFTSYSSDSTDPYLLDVLLAGFDLDASTHGEQTMQFYEDTYIPVQMTPCNRVYDSHGGSHRSNVLAYLNAGQHLWIHTDHGGISELGCGYVNHSSFLYESDMDALANGPNYTIMTAMACLIGGFDSSDCFTEHFLNAANGGGVAAMTNSREGWYNPGANPQRTLSALYVEWLVYSLFGHGGNGSLEDFAISKSMLVPLADTNATYRWCMYVYNLFGEPAMRMWVPTQVAIGGRGNPIPAGATASLTAPSHFSTTVTLRALLPAGGPVRVAIYDQSGRKVRTLSDGTTTASVHSLVWRGDDERARELPPGVYCARTDAGCSAAACRLVKVTKE
jgi:hypothetical protein